jgi:transposase
MDSGKGKRTYYTREFKQEAVQLALNSDRSLPQIAAELGIPVSNLRHWKRAYQGDAQESFPGSDRLPPSEEEVRKLRRELERVKQERDVLKKVVGIFSQRPT